MDPHTSRPARRPRTRLVWNREELWATAAVASLTIALVLAGWLVLAERDATSCTPGAQHVSQSSAQPTWA